MKLKWSASAVLAIMSGAAHAQSSVTLYGAIDTGLFYQSTSAASYATNAKNQGHIYTVKDAGLYGSYWGIKGTEDLGGGYKANFRLQGIFNSGSGKLGLGDTTGAATLFNMQSTVGVSGPFGSIDLGRQFTPMIYAMADTDVRAAEYFGSIYVAWLGMNTAAHWTGTNTNLPIGGLFDSYAIVYQSPKFYGTSFALEYAPGGVPGQIQGGSRESAVLRYSNYGLNLAAMYYNAHDTNLAAATPTGLDNNRLYYLGAKYTFHGLSVSAGYGIGENPSDRGATNIELISGGLGYQFSPFFTLTSGFYYLRDRNEPANHSSEYALGAECSVSKRTVLYAQMGYVANHGTMNSPITFGQPVAPGVATTAAMLGIRHSF
ncbi:porin [Paraburkholderia sp. CNPSo 3076]|uniref:porin n=1 Tax=Paraburkholderia sp. CNPSo 3076 TaxID=2940936 RepID=UPI00225536A9|nr:porin [Paraburkholderia sp. CNPSo 3076]MCX5544113.1 porin [Paraburkholderia sp. CNPSo 3076]